MTTGIVAYGAYLPCYRLQREGIGEARRRAPGCDEDTTAMGVEAARTALSATALRPEALYFATAAPAYLDKTNATAIHAALALDAAAPAFDLAGAVRSGAGALRAALAAPRPPP